MLEYNAEGFLDARILVLGVFEIGSMQDCYENAK
jgi:hypothetical protein